MGRKKNNFLTLLGITTLLGLAIYSHTPPKTREITPIGFVDINGDGVEEVIIGNVNNGYIKGLANYLHENAYLLRHRATDCMSLNPSQYIDPLLELKYVDGNKTTKINGRILTQEIPKSIGEIHYYPGLETKLKFKMSETSKRLYIGRPGMISSFDIDQSKSATE
ncbi:MAG: hypothetical protein AABX35_04330 [Nanoarchaeota archaeon]